VENAEAAPLRGWIGVHHPYGVAIDELLEQIGELS
jgi:hypothetical protein